MHYSGTMNNKINRQHERCSCLLYGNKTSCFEKLLKQDKSVGIYTSMFKIDRNISQPISSEIFHRIDINYNL